MGAVSACVTQPCLPKDKQLASSESSFFELYEIGDIIGSGAFGQVRKCWTIGEKDDGAYAVKAIDTQAESYTISVVDCLPPTMEAKILQAVRHTHIVKLIDIFLEDGWLFVVEERIGGGELFASFADPKLCVTESCVAVAGYQLLQALQYLHDRNIVHRDVKAENVLLSSLPSQSGMWDIKLIDFGLAMRMEQSPLFLRICREEAHEPFEKIICGTAYYCAPEVWANSYGPKVDVWAVGVMMYLALFGIYPFYDKDPNAIEALICKEGAEPPWKPTCAVKYPNYMPSRSAQTCLTSLLDKDASERPSAAKALKDTWLRRGKSLQASPSSNKSQGALGVAAERALDPSIPVGVRAAAGRAAARPPISSKEEADRTAALNFLQSKALSSSRSSRSGSRPSPRSSIVKSSAALSRGSWGGSSSRSSTVSNEELDGALFSDSEGEDGLGNFFCH